MSVYVTTSYDSYRGGYAGRVVPNTPAVQVANHKAHIAAREADAAEARAASLSPRHTSHLVVRAHAVADASARAAEASVRAASAIADASAQAMVADAASIGASSPRSSYSSLPGSPLRYSTVSNGSAYAIAAANADIRAVEANAAVARAEEAASIRNSLSPPRCVRNSGYVSPPPPLSMY